MTALHTIRSVSRGRAARPSLWSRIVSWHGLWVQRRQLTSLSDAQLDDIGLTEAEAAREAQRPFWDAPLHWR